MRNEDEERAYIANREYSPWCMLSRFPSCFLHFVAANASPSPPAWNPFSVRRGLKVRGTGSTAAPSKTTSLS